MTFILHSQLLSMAAFVHTVETGSFTAAAVRMGVSKSATGKHVARLEQRLGVKLLNRTTRSISLTEEGELYYRSCLIHSSSLHWQCRRAAFTYLPGLFKGWQSIALEIAE